MIKKLMIVLLLLLILMLNVVIGQVQEPTDVDTTTAKRITQEHENTRKFVSNELNRAKTQYMQEMTEFALEKEILFTDTLKNLLWKLVLGWSAIVFFVIGLSGLLKTKLEERKFKKLKKALVDEVKAEIGIYQPPQSIQSPKITMDLSQDLKQQVANQIKVSTQQAQPQYQQPQYQQPQYQQSQYQQPQAKMGFIKWWAKQKRDRKSLALRNQKSKLEAQLRKIDGVQEPIPVPPQQPLPPLPPQYQQPQQQQYQQPQKPESNIEPNYNYNFEVEY